MHLRLSAAADGTDDELVSFAMEFGPMQARRVPPLVVLARDSPDAAEVALEDMYFAPPVAGVSEALGALAAQLGVRPRGAVASPK